MSCDLIGVENLLYTEITCMTSSRDVHFPWRRWPTEHTGSYPRVAQAEVLSNNPIPFTMAAVPSVSCLVPPVFMSVMTCMHGVVCLPHPEEGASAQRERAAVSGCIPPQDARSLRPAPPFFYAHVEGR